MLGMKTKLCGRRKAFLDVLPRVYHHELCSYISKIDVSYIHLSENERTKYLLRACGLNFNLHISNVCKKASQRIGGIMRLRNLIPTEAKLSLFKAAIFSHI